MVSGVKLSLLVSFLEFLKKLQGHSQPVRFPNRQSINTDELCNDDVSTRKRSRVLSKVLFSNERKNSIVLICAGSLKVMASNLHKTSSEARRCSLQAI